MLKKLQKLLQKNFDTEASDKALVIEPLDQYQTLSLILMTEIGLADGAFSPEERDHLMSDLHNEYELTDEQAEKAVAEAIREVREAHSLQHFTAPLKNLPYDDKLSLLENLWRLAYADKQLDPYEESMLRKLADLLYISHSDYIKTKLAVQEQ
ncbi:TerB family tellurite resistance protein [Idiomarina seosinensis]|uniref:tellurite resistance TerB family protein n=1 Tax=Idiomarina seosinensis TaxID=281739 RepID=UPI00384B3F2A